LLCLILLHKNKAMKKLYLCDLSGLERSGREKTNIPPKKREPESSLLVIL